HPVAPGERRGQHRSVALERLAKAGLVRGDADLRDLSKVIQSHQLLGRDQTPTRRDDEHSRCCDRGAREGPPVGELAAEIETAEKAEDLADRRPGPAQPRRQRKRGALAKKDVGALSVAARRREKEYGP